MIEAIDVHKTFRSGDDVVEALRGVTFELPAGSCAFIVGPSGSGKSTLLYLLAALDSPTSGTIRIAGQDITAMSENQEDDYRRNQVGFVYQSFNLITNLSAVNNVLLPYIPTGVTPELRAKASGLLEQVGLGHRLKRRPAQLSGGEQQRVAIARALVSKPLLLLADEPTGNLDSASSDQIMAVLRNLVDEQGHTILMVTHDARHAAMASRVLRLRDGQVVEEHALPGARPLNDILEDLEVSP